MVKTVPSNAGAAGSIPDGGTKIPHASLLKNQNEKQKQYCIQPGHAVRVSAGFFRAVSSGAVKTTLLMCSCTPEWELRADSGARCYTPELPRRPLARGTEPAIDR